MNLRIDQAWRLNPALLVLGLPALALLMTDMLGTVIWRSRLQFIPQARFGIVLGVVLVAYAVLRNVA